MNFEFKCQLADDEKGQSAKDICLTYLRLFIAEFLGTFLLVYFGCACIHHLSNFLGMSLCFGFVIGAIIQVVAAISIAHLNPAVTVCFYIFGIISLPSLFIYWIAQCVGAIVGAFLLKEMSIFDDLNSKTKSNCCTYVGNGVSLGRAFAWEFGLTSFLILMVCSVIHPKTATRLDSISLKFGALIFILIYSGGDYTSTGINPARSLGPAIVHNEWSDHWIYWAAPLTASIVTSVGYHIFCLPKNGQEAFKQAIKENREAYKK